MRLPVYKGLFESKTTIGIPTTMFMILAAILPLSYLFIKSILVIIPNVMLFVFIKYLTKNDTNFLTIYMKNAFYPNRLS